VTVPLVIGLGRADRGDDAIGPEVARTFAERCEAGVEVMEFDQPADLMDVWSGRELVVVVDAVRSGAEPGTIHVLDLGAAQVRSAEKCCGSSGQGGTHGFGIDSVVGLARALGTLPSKLVLVGVEGSSFVHGAAMSPVVAGAMEATVAEVMAQVAGVTPGRPVVNRLRPPSTGAPHARPGPDQPWPPEDDAPR
jgi:hydrogenase maturation protease